MFLSLFDIVSFWIKILFQKFHVTLNLKIYRKNKRKHAIFIEDSLKGIQHFKNLRKI